MSIEIARRRIMGCEWQKHEWGEIVTLEYGKSLRDYRSKYGGYRVYGTNGPIGWHDEPLCKHSGVIIGRKGAYRGIHYSATPFFVIDTAFYLEPKLEIDLRWAYYCLLTYDINGMDSGSAIPSTSREAFYRLPVRVPPIDEQRAIAHVLGTLDDKIELNRRMNETLEAMARAVFKSWFVDFDPIPGLGPHREWQDSPLGRIPKGWNVATLGDFSSLNPEVWSKETRSDVLKYVDLSNTKWGRIETVTIYAKGEAPSRAQRVLRAQDTIVGTVRPGNGSYAFILEEGLTGSTGFAVLRPLKAEYAEIVYLTATAADNIERLAHLADGAAYPAVRPDVVVATQIMKPVDKVLRAFSQIVAPLLAKMSVTERESRALANISDALLPKLLSGEIRVKNVEKYLAGTV